MAKCYVRNGVWGWSVDRQEKALIEAGALDPRQLYKDVLPQARSKRPAQVRPEWLLQRADLLRRGRETIHVATLLAWGVGEVDLVHAIAQAAACNATVIAVDSKLAITPDAGAAGVNAAMDDWMRAKKLAQTQPGRRIGNQVAAEMKKARTMVKLRIARPLWSLPLSEISSEDVAAKANLSVKTLYTYLGRRNAGENEMELFEEDVA